MRYISVFGEYVKTFLKAYNKCWSLVKRHPGWSYILTIFFFAGVYSLIPDEFYQSTSVQEGQFNYYDDKMKSWAIKIITDEITTKRSVARKGCYSDLSNNLEYENLTARTYIRTKERKNHVYVDKISININFWIKCDNNVGYQQSFDLHTGSRLHGWIVAISKSFAEKAYFDPGRYTIIDYNFMKESECAPYKKLFPGITYDDFNNLCYLPIKDSQHEELQYFRNEYDIVLNGGVSGHNKFWRMIYFSAVTITTLGYGDIVPLTIRSRILVAIESVIGILIIGLFLNSLVEKRNKEFLTNDET